MLVAEARPVVRDALAALLDGRLGASIVVMSDADSVTAALGRRPRPHLLVLGPRIVGGRVEALTAYAARRRQVPVLALVGDPAMGPALLAAGAIGVLDASTSDGAMLVEAARAAMNGTAALSPGVERALVADPPPAPGAVDPRDRLSPREIEVVALYAEGRTTGAIASILGVSPRTIETHRARILGKLGLQDTFALITVARAWSIGAPDVTSVGSDGAAEI